MTVDAPVSPHSIEAEQSVIGALLLDNAAVARMNGLVAADFYNAEHRVVVSKIFSLIEAGYPADVITVHDALRSEVERDDLLPYLNAIAQNTPSAANIARYADIVRERATRRELAAKFDEAKDRITSGQHDSDSVAAWLDDAITTRRAGPAARGARVPLRATAWRWTDPKSLPPRRLIMGSHYHRGHVGVSAGPGGVSKSMREAVDAVSLCVGRDLLGRDRVYGGPKRVWLMQLEDSRDETAGRRIGAICIRYAVEVEAVEGRLYVDSGRDRGLCIATGSQDGVVLNIVDIEALKAEIVEREIDVLMVDPFVESHTVSEALNDQIKVVMAQWRQIAHDCDIAIDLVHHLRKNGGTEASIDDVRGAVAMVGSARSVRLFSSMSEKEAQDFGIEKTERRRYVSVNPHGKANFSPPSDARDWYHLETIALGNATDEYPEGDRVGVPAPWSLPGPLAEVTLADCFAIKALAAAQTDPAATARAHRQASGWFGHVVARHLDIDVNDPQNGKKIERILAGLLQNRFLREGMAKNEKREMRPVFLPENDEASR